MFTDVPSSPRRRCPAQRVGSPGCGLSVRFPDRRHGAALGDPGPPGRGNRPAPFPLPPRTPGGEFGVGLLQNHRQKSGRRPAQFSRACAPTVGEIQFLYKSKPFSHLRCWGGGLGMGLGIALGAKLAQPQNIVVAIIGDGAWHYNPVPAAHGSAQEYGLLLLIIPRECRGARAQLRRRRHRAHTRLSKSCRGLWRSWRACAPAEGFGSSTSACAGDCYLRPHIPPGCVGEPLILD